MRVASGYTLLEMLVVLSVVAILMAAGFSAIRSKPEFLQLQSLTTKLQSDIRYAHSLSIQKQAVIRISIDPNNGTWRLDEKHHGAMLTGAVLSVKSEGATGGLMFYPDGTCTGASIDLMLGQMRRSFSVDWLGCRIYEPLLVGPLPSRFGG